MSAVTLSPNVQLTAKINELKEIFLKGEHRLKSSKEKLPRTFGENKNKRYVFGRTKNGFYHGDDEYIRMVNAANNRIEYNGEKGYVLKLLREIMTLHDPEFTYCQIQVNEDSISEWHKDEGNKPGCMSYGFSFGDFECEPHPDTKEVGDLWINNNGEIQVINYYNKLTKFDAQNMEHRTNPKIMGKRFAVLYYTASRATDVDLKLNMKYLVLRDTNQREPYYQLWLQDAIYDKNGELLSPEKMEYIEKNKQSYEEVRENRDLKFNPEYQISTTDFKVNWKKCNTLILNMQSATDRRRHMEDNLKKFGFTNIAMFKAVDGMTLQDEFTYEENGVKFIDQTKFKQVFNAPSRHPVNRNGQNGGWKDTRQCLREIGCALGHVRMWEYALAEGWNNLLVMEDDVDFDNEIFQRDTFTLKKNTECIMMGWRGEGASKDHTEYYLSQPGEFVPFVEGKNINQTHCYLLPTRESIQKLYDYYKPYIPGKLDTSAPKIKGNHAIDLVLSEKVYHKLNTKLCKLPVMQLQENQAPSQIRGKGHLLHHH